MMTASHPPPTLWSLDDGVLEKRWGFENLVWLISLLSQTNRGWWMHLKRENASLKKNFFAVGHMGKVRDE